MYVSESPQRVLVPEQRAAAPAEKARGRKRILLYGTNYYPEPIGIPRYTTEMAEDMVASGFDVTVIAAAPLYPTWTKQPGYKYRRYSRETRNGVTIRRVPTYAPRNAASVQRIVYEVVFFLMSFPLVIREAVRGIHALVITIPPLLLCLALMLPMGRVRRAVIVKDLQIDIAENLKIIRSPALLGFLYRIERFLLSRADVVTAVSRGMLRRICSKGFSERQTALFPDWVDVEQLQEAARERAIRMRRRLGLPLDRVLVGYSGNLARKQGLELLIEVAARFARRGRRDIHFLICGDGPAKPGLQAEVRERELINVSFAPLQPESDLPVLLTAIDVHVILQRDEVSDLVMPGKMFNIMACRRPQIVTAPAASAIDGVITESGAGIRVSRDDLDILEQSIERLCQSAELRQTMGDKGRDYVCEHMAKRKLLDVFYRRLFPEEARA
jgi:colanic acid biosynthesis glycosyl transferase WcaI